MYKKRRKFTFDIERVSDTHYAAKSSKDFSSPFRTKKRHYQFPIDDRSVVGAAEKEGLDILWPHDRAQRSYTRQVASVSLDDRLFPHQKEGVRIAAGWGRAMIGDEMGVGKSAQGIALAKHFGGRVCVACPSYLCKNWKREFEFWYPHDIAIVGKTVPDSSVIVSYDLTHRRNLGKFNVLIMDESHYVKNKSAKRTKVLMRMARMTPHVFLLTGTPAPNKPVELWTQIAMILGKSIGTYTSFAHRYCGAKQSPLGFVDVSGATHTSELAWFMKSTMLIRRLKRDVLKDLPPKTRTTLEVDVPCKGMKKKFKRWKEINQLCLKNETHELIFERKRLVNELFLMTAEAKVDVIKKICADLPPKTLVFVHHKVLGDAVEEVLPCIRIDGSTPRERRDEYVKDFQEGRVDYACLSMLAAGTGITLTRATNILFAELYFVPGVLMQAEDRAHRIGLQSPLTVTYVIANGSLDNHMFKRATSKLSTLDKCLDGRSDRKFM